MKKILIGLIGLILIGFIIFSWMDQPPPLSDKDWFDVQAHWQLGQIVILMRHAERCDRSDSPCIAGKDGISKRGKQMAQRLGQHMARALNLDQAVIYHSYLPRTAQTAAYLFGERSQAVRWLKEDCKTHLFQRLFEYKPVHKNMILIGHSTCMRDLGKAEGQPLIGLDVVNDHSYGMAFFIAMDLQHRRAYPIGYLRPEDWHDY